MVTNTKIDQLDLTVDRLHALEVEVARLEAELAAVSADLEEEQAHSASLKRVVDRAKQRIHDLEEPQSDGVDLGFGSRTGTTATGAMISGAMTTQSDVDGAESDDRRGRKGKRRGSRKKKAARADKRRSAGGGSDSGGSRSGGGNVYVFDDQDETRIAFDEFFGNPDPDLDKVRGFLLD